MEPSSSGISWGTSYGFGTIQVTSETVDWSQMWRFWNAFTLSVLHDVIIYDLHAWYIYIYIYINIYIYICIYVCIHIYLIVHFETCTVYILHPYLESYTSHWLMLSVLQTTENKFISSYLIITITNNVHMMRIITTINYIIKHTRILISLLLPVTQ